MPRGFFLRAARAALVQDREEACDALTLEAGADRSEYASLLLELATCPTGSLPGTQGMISRRTDAYSTIERRIRMIIGEKRGTAWSPLVRRATAVVAALAAVFICTASVPPLFAVDAAGPAPTAGITSVTAEGKVRIAQYDLAGLPCAAPLAGNWRVSMPFGAQMNPITGTPYLHTGIDLTNGRSGDPVQSAMAGLVIETGTDKVKGRYIVIANAGVEVCVQKLKEIRVTMGQTVAVGAEIGTVGSSGVSTGPHLHYEIRVNGIAVDPGALLRAGNASYGGL